MSPQPGMQVFRISMHPKPRAQVESMPDAQSGCLRTRRAHNKSRGGCQSCKQKRKKCDEARPRCSACVKRDCDCHYDDEKRARAAKPSKALVPKLSVDGSSFQFATPGVLLSTSQHTKYDLILLDHFMQATSKDLNGRNSSFPYSTRALDLAKERPYLMHAAIAQSACQLNHLNPEEPKYRLAEAFHTQLASRGLCDAVSSINGLKDCDAILTTAMLINGITFCSAEYRDDKHVPQWWWLRVQLGLGELLVRTSPYHPDSMWKSMFDASNAFQILEPPTNNLAQRLSDFCGITADSTEDNCIYFDPIQWLEPIISRPPNKAYLLLYLRFIGSITTRFVDLLEARDEKALLIFANWLALMCSINQWWSVRRTTRECWKICDYLMPRLKGRDLELIELPAMACGYL